MSQLTNESKTRLIIRCDDIGLCHGVNMAFKRILDEGIATSASVMVTTPWFEEAVAILKEHPEISVGVHLNFNSEWKKERWGPVSPYTEVPSIVDEFGKFYGTRKEFMAHQPKIAEVAKEMRAQIEYAKRKGLNISYIDNHMGTAISTLEFQQEMEKLAKEYGIGISRYFQEIDIGNVYSYPPEQKLAEGLNLIASMTTAGTYLLVCHVGSDTPEMQAMTDVHTFGLKDMAKHRQAETDMLCAPKFKQAIEKKGFQLVGYNEMIKEGLDKMKRPFTSDTYETVMKDTTIRPVK
ncbi:MAG: polysaccharide deacetylase family protein [bacterium]|nr:polysaccharide deacetylase family protein [bacterium]